MFRLPRERHFTLLTQHQGQPEIVPSISNLNGKSGYVVVPFEPSHDCPILLIHPDDMQEGEIETLETMPNSTLHHQDDNGLRRQYGHDFHKFHDALQQGRFSKLVLSRSVEYGLTRPLQLRQLFMQACQLYPRAFVALISSTLCGTWLMATPEILLSGDGIHFSTMALAGTMQLTKESAGFDVPGSHFDARNICWSDKNVHEQHCVETYLTEQLAQFSTNVIRTSPYTARAGHLVHLRTDFHFDLPSHERLGDLLKALHPTPAVCGLPKNDARRFIMDNESSARCYYSGFSGLLNHFGHTRLFVSLRCMNISEKAVRLHAGGGLLSESSEQQEWEETEAKMETMKRLFNHV